MRLRLALMIFVILAICPVAFTACTGASPTWTCTADYASINALINSNSPAGFTANDTINVSAGSASWGASQLSITRGVKLIASSSAPVGKGAGTSNVTISTTATAAISIQPNATAVTNEEVVRVEGFTFDGGNTAAQFITVGGAAASGTKPWRYLILYNNIFKNEGGGSSDPAIYIIGGQTRGVVSHNTFDRCNMIFRPHGANTVTEWNNSAYYPFAYGSADQIFFEDNKILWSTAYTDKGNSGMIQAEQAGRVVIRYNSFDYTNISNAEIDDIHGSQNWDGTLNSGAAGTMVEEMYGNVIVNGTASIFRWINHRGSWGLYFNNSYAGATNPVIEINQYATGDSGGSGCDNMVNPALTAGRSMQVNNTYTFNNTDNGTLTNMTAGTIGDGCGTAENTSWFNYNASCTSSACSAGIGRGATAPTGTCTIGVGYWVASTATPTTTSSVIQSGAFYKCTSTNVWTLYYTPYTYPSPLLSSGAAPVVAPAASMFALLK